MVESPQFCIQYLLRVEMDASDALTDCDRVAIADCKAISAVAATASLGAAVRHKATCIHTCMEQQVPIGETESTRQAEKSWH
jgi:hypothetical protein